MAGWIASSFPSPSRTFFLHIWIFFAETKTWTLPPIADYYYSGNGLWKNVWRFDTSSLQLINPQNNKCIHHQQPAWRKCTVLKVLECVIINAKVMFAVQYTTCVFWLLQHWLQSLWVSFPTHKQSSIISIKIRQKSKGVSRRKIAFPGTEELISLDNILPTTTKFLMDICEITRKLVV